MALLPSRGMPLPLVVPSGGQNSHTTSSTCSTAAAAAACQGPSLSRHGPVGGRAALVGYSLPASRQQRTSGRLHKLDNILAEQTADGQAPHPPTHPAWHQAAREQQMLPLSLSPPLSLTATHSNAGTARAAGAAACCLSLAAGTGSQSVTRQFHGLPIVDVQASLLSCCSAAPCSHTLS